MYNTQQYSIKYLPITTVSGKLKCGFLFRIPESIPTIYGTGDSNISAACSCKDGINVANYTYDYNNLLIESNSSITGINDMDKQFLEFSYGTDNQRYRKFDFKNNEVTLYSNKDYEQIYKGGVLNQSKYYVTSYMTITKDYTTGDKHINFMQKDRLGSTTQVLDNMTIAERNTFIFLSKNLGARLLQQSLL